MRDAAGSDNEPTGMHAGVAHELYVRDARATGATLDEEGAELIEHAWGHPIDYYDEQAVLKVYYDECARVVKERTGAQHVLAFDHNIRSREKAKAKLMLNGGNQVQGPAGGTHADYSVTSAPNRVRNLAKPLGINDTLRGLYGDGPVVDEGQLDELLSERFQFINVWRNISETPVHKTPLGVLDARSCPLDDIITYEVHYADRVGENYLVSHSDAHRWLYFPRMTRDEAMLIKCWDSGGEDFCDHHDMPNLSRSTFCFHCAFEDESDPKDAPERESIEVRTIAFFSDVPPTLGDKAKF